MERVARDAAAATLAALPGAPDEAEQLSLLGFADAAAVLEQEGDTLALRLAAWERNGRKGRKPGALNRRSGDLAEYLLQFGPHPAVGMMQMQGRPARLLAAELGCKPIEAAELQQKVRAELLPYFEGKKPVAIQLESQAAIYVMPGMPGLDGQLPVITAADPRAIEAAAPPMVQIVEDQPLSDEHRSASE